MEQQRKAPLGWKRKSLQLRFGRGHEPGQNVQRSRPICSASKDPNNGEACNVPLRTVRWHVPDLHGADRHPSDATCSRSCDMCGSALRRSCVPGMVERESAELCVVCLWPMNTCSFTFLTALAPIQGRADSPSPVPEAMSFSPKRLVQKNLQKIGPSEAMAAQLAASPVRTVQATQGGLTLCIAVRSRRLLSTARCSRAVPTDTLLHAPFRSFDGQGGPTSTREKSPKPTTHDVDEYMPTCSSGLVHHY